MIGAVLPDVNSGRRTAFDTRWPTLLGLLKMNAALWKIFVICCLPKLVTGQIDVSSLDLDELASKDRSVR